MARSRVEITGSVPVEEGGRGRLAVAYVLFAGRDGDVAELELEVEHDAGVLSGRLTPPPIARGTGRGSVDLELRALPAGSALVRITPRGPRGAPGEPGMLPIAVPATGSDPTLRIVSFAAADAEVARPGPRSVAAPGFALRWEGAGDAVLHVTVEDPGGRVAARRRHGAPGRRGDGEPRDVRRQVARRRAPGDRPAGRR